MTKEEVQKENAVLKEDNRRLGEQEKELRKGFARVFGWFNQTQDRWTHEVKEELKELSWAEIFAKVGKLLATVRESTNAEYIERQEERLRNIERSIENLFQKDNK